MFRTPWPSLDAPPNGKRNWSHGRRLLGSEISVAGQNVCKILPSAHLSTSFRQVPKLEDRQLNTAPSYLVRSSRQTRLVNFDSSFETFSPLLLWEVARERRPHHIFCAGFPAIPLWDPLRSPTNGIISREGARIIHNPPVVSLVVGA